MQCEFVQLFDAVLIREVLQAAPRHQNLILDRTESEVLPHERCGLAEAEEANIELIEGEADATRLAIRWQWPDSNISNRCTLLISETQPPANIHPDSIDAFFRVTIDRARWDADEQQHSVTPEDDWEGAYVAAYAVIDLGTQTLTTAPLYLGRIETSKRKRWGLFG